MRFVKYQDNQIKGKKISILCFENCRDVIKFRIRESKIQVSICIENDKRLAESVY